MTNYGTKFAETETLLAALEGDSREVVRRCSEMYPNERRELDQACGLISVVCTLVESNETVVVSESVGTRTPPHAENDGSSDRDGYGLVHQHETDRSTETNE